MAALRFARALVLAGTVLAAGSGVPRAAEAEVEVARVVVIVHPTRQVALRTDGAPIFLRQRRFWPGGDPIVPVNRDAASAARAGFTRLVFGSSAARLAAYWNRQYFLGVLPPATLASDEAVKRFVANEPSAIGYVTAATTDASVKVVLTLE